MPLNLKSFHMPLLLRANAPARETLPAIDFRCPLRICSALLITTMCSLATAQENWQPLFNGKDLAGWKIVNVAPMTFSVRDEMIVSTGKPTGTMRTERMYENFIMEAEWRHMHPTGNAGIFIWGDPITHVGTPFSRGIE